MKLSELARRFEVSEDALSRHRKHQVVAMSRPELEDKRQLLYGARLLNTVAHMLERVEKQEREAERTRDGKGVLAAVKVRLEILEFGAKLTGQIRNESKSLTVNQTNVSISAAEAEEVRRKLFVRFGLEPPPALEAKQ